MPAQASGGPSDLGAGPCESGLTALESLSYAMENELKQGYTQSRNAHLANLLPNEAGLSLLVIAHDRPSQIGTR